MKTNKWLVAITVLFAIFFAACEKDVTESYQLSNEIKEVGNFDVGSTWEYDVTFKDTVWFTYTGLYLDTFVVGDTIRFTDYVVVGKDSIHDVYGNLVYKNKIEKIDTFRVVAKLVENIYGVKVPNVAFSIEDVFQITHTYPYGQGVTFSVDTTHYILFDILKMNGVERQNERNSRHFIEDVDTFYVRYPYTIKKAFGPQVTTDIFALTKVDEADFDYGMRNLSSSNESLNRVYSSSLWPEAIFTDLYYAASGGNEFYKRQVTSKYSTENMILFNYFNNELETDLEEVKNGTYSITLDTIPVVEGGVTYDKHWVVKSNVRNYIKNILYINDLEIWMVDGNGIIKMKDNTVNAEWKLKSLSIK